jgi:hypothetical protein
LQELVFSIWSVSKLGRAMLGLGVIPTAGEGWQRTVAGVPTEVSTTGELEVVSMEEECLGRACVFSNKAMERALSCAIRQSCLAPAVRTSWVLRSRGLLRDGAEGVPHLPHVDQGPGLVFLIVG